jgi:hypothetical protein
VKTLWDGIGSVAHTSPFQAHAIEVYAQTAWFPSSDSAGPDDELAEFVVARLSSRIWG